MRLFGKAMAFMILAVHICVACNWANRRSKALTPLNDAVPYELLKTELENIFDTDQAIREKLMASKGKEFGEIMYQMMQIDSINQAKIKPILRRYGWLPKSKVGEKASDAIFLVIQHSDVDLMRQYFPSLKDLASRGEAKPTHAAMMEDRLLVNEGKKQIYGTQARSESSTNGKAYIWPIENSDVVNQLRKEVGFDLTVEVNAKRLGAIYDPKRELSDVK